MNLNNKEIRGKYPEKSGEGNKDDSYRGYSIDLGHFDGDFNEGKLSLIYLLNKFIILINYFY